MSERRFGFSFTPVSFWNVLLLLDTSGSMREGAGTDTRWTLTRNALTAFCPTSCQALQMDSGSRVDLVFGCATQVID